MEFVLTPEQMAAADRAAVAAGTPVEELMERAGWALARGVRDVMGGVYGRRVTLVCGKGNNGGDGRIAARVLATWGARADVFDLDAAMDRNRLARSLGRADAAVDAMYGTGFRGTLEGDAAHAVELLAVSGVPVISCDIPSGVDGLTGSTSGPAVDAVLTVSFAALKTGLLFSPGRGHAGVIRVAPISVDVTNRSDHPAYLLNERDVALLLPERDSETHKWTAGAVFVVAGQEGMLGAATMVARAALRSGAGLVVLGVPGRELASQASGGEVITRALTETPEGFLDEPAATDVLKELDRFRAVVIGPGLGTDARTVAAVRRIVAEASVPVVIDADGLNALAGDPASAAAIIRGRDADTVLTPHAGEYARLRGEAPAGDRIAATRTLAEEFEAVALLKGSTTVIADPKGHAVLNTTGGPWLATAGTGDVLAGIIGSLLAQGLPGFEAAASGAWVHGRAADDLPHEGLVAGDLIEALPKTLADVKERDDL